MRFHPRFLDYARHQGFKPVACAPYQPQEKGRVENAVRFLRTGFLAGREKHDLGHLNEQVTRWLAEVANQRLHRTTGRKPAVMLAEEMPLLWPLPGKAYDTRLVLSLKVGSTCRVRFETNTYSVPPKNVGMLLTLKASDDRVTLFAAGEQVASHQRCKGRHQDVVDPEHVRSLLRRKRRGERGAVVQRFLALCPTAAGYLKGLTHAEIALYQHLHAGEGAHADPHIQRASCQSDGGRRGLRLQAKDVHEPHGRGQGDHRLQVNFRPAFLRRRRCAERRPSMTGGKLATEPVLIAGAVYWADGGRRICRACASALFAGRDLSGRLVARVTLDDVRDWPADLGRLRCEMACTELAPVVAADGWPIASAGRGNEEGYE